MCKRDEEGGQWIEQNTAKTLHAIRPSFPLNFWICASQGVEKEFSTKVRNVQGLLLEAKDLHCLTSYWKKDFSCSHCVYPPDEKFPKWSMRMDVKMTVYCILSKWTKRNGMKWTKGACWTNWTRYTRAKGRESLWVFVPEWNEKKSKEHYIIDCSVPLKHYFWFSLCEVSLSENGARKWSIGALLTSTYTNAKNPSTANNWLFVAKAKEFLIHKHNALLCCVFLFISHAFNHELKAHELNWCENFPKRNKTNRNRKTQLLCSYFYLEDSI